MPIIEITEYEKKGFHFVKVCDGWKVVETGEVFKTAVEAERAVLKRH